MTNPCEFNCPDCGAPLFRSQKQTGRLCICTGCEKTYVLINRSGQAELLEKSVSEEEAKAAIQQLPLHISFEKTREEADKAKRIVTAPRAKSSGLVIVVIMAVIAGLALFFQPEGASHAIVLEYMAMRFLIVSALAVLLFTEYSRSQSAEQVYRTTYPQARQLYFKLLEEYYARLAGTSILEEERNDNVSRQHQIDHLPQ